ncbi:hypothetical protein GUJ93_ZPchr0005g16216 [Zizania palustris]|uniref:O-methyltransferase n=1 Tax=Zizania palustris TaxID=103762 RepID=A0A8J5VHL7_ZIZPA|nr:hypothetical protein GUJ93_ZPchr0005g16216 [Zizania palustris]
MALTQSNENASLLDAQVELYGNTFAFIKSMALKSAMDLRIADAIQQHGGGATLDQIAAKVTIHPSKISYLRRLMRVLVISGVFTVQHLAPSTTGEDEPVYMLTSSSRLLVGSSNNLVSITSFALLPTMVTPFLAIGKWFQNDLVPDQCIFKHMHGQSIWELTDNEAALDAHLNDGMVSDSHFVMDIFIKEYGEVFQGISSLVDVAGGLGAAAHAISKAFPELKCCVLDLGHVIAKAPIGTDVEYISGDMFDNIPPANVVLLKSVLHDWADDECIKILKNCKKAIPSRDVGSEERL